MTTWASMHLLRDGRCIERAPASIRREFLLDPAAGFFYDVPRDRAAEPDMAAHRRMVLEWFSGTSCVDGLHVGRLTMVLASDPLAGLPAALALVDRNDADHMRPFLGNLKSRELRRRVVIIGRSNPHPELLGRMWPEADHPLCDFYLLKSISGLILDAVRRLEATKARRGRPGRKRKRGRKGTRARSAARCRCPTNRQEVHFVFKHRHLVVKRREESTAADRDDLARMLESLPELAAPQRCAGRI